MRHPLLFVLTLLPLSAMAEVPRVVTDFAPIDALVRQVMGDLGAPTMLLPAGGDPHDFQMRPSQAQALAGADLVFWDGPELMPGLAEAMDTLVVQGRMVALLHDGGGKLRMFDGGAGTDPHAWLAPPNAVAWLGTIATDLAQKDPANAATYRANAAAAQAQIQALDGELATLLAPARGVPIVVFHDAFGYFADHYALDIVGAIELGDAAPPSAAQLRDIRSLIAEKRAVCVFPEAGRDPKFIETVVGDSPVRIGAGQDPEALGLTPGPGLYAMLLRGLAKTIADCVGG